MRFANDIEMTRERVRRISAHRRDPSIGSSEISEHGELREPPSAAKVDRIRLGVIENQATDEGLRVRRVTLALATNV